MLSLPLTHIHPVTEFYSIIEHTGYEVDLALLEEVHYCWSKQISEFNNVEHGARLAALGLFSVKGRLLRVGMT